MSIQLGCSAGLSGNAAQYLNKRIGCGLLGGDKMSNISQIAVLAGTINVCAEEMRDTSDMDKFPYLWTKLEPIIENIEGCANSIKQIAKELQA